MATLNDAATLVGLVTGLSGFVLAILNYARDNPKVLIELQWDMTDSGTNQTVGVVQISNTGRRPIFVSHVALRLPKGYGESHLLLKEGLEGRRLAEGDAPMRFVVTYDGMKKYSGKWQDVRAQVSDSTGKEWLSKKPPKKRMPSWAKSKS